MVDYKINPFAISYDTIQNNLRLMIANNSDSFTDFFNDGSGSSVIDLAAALGAFFAYHVITQRKEFTLEQATNYKSLIGNAFDKGYNVKRGQNLRVNLTVTPNTNGSLQPWTVLGQYAEYDVTLMERATFIEGRPTTLTVTIGNRRSESLIANTSKVTLFRFVSDDVTDDVRLFLNDTELSDYSTDIQDLLDDKYVMMSNSYGSVNVFYLQEGSKKYTVGDYITLDYIARNSIDFDSLSMGAFALPGFTVTDMTLAEERKTIEDKDSIRMRAVLQAETEGIIRARADFIKILAMLDEIASISDEDIQPGRIGIHILKDDMQPLTEEDKIKFQKLIDSRVVSGVANVIYENAQKYKTPLSVQLTSSDSENTATNLLNKINEALLKYQYVIGSFINFDDIEKYIEEQVGIKVARLKVPTSAWKPNKPYRMSDTAIATEFNDKAYYVSVFRMTTGSVEPNWLSPNEQGYIVDNNILWKAYTGNKNNLGVWEADKQIKVGTLIIDYPTKKAFECVGYAMKSGEQAPTWADVDDYIIDNNIVWERIQDSDNYKEYKTSSIYSIGDDIRVNQGTEDEEDIVYFRAIDYAVLSGETEPVWNDISADGYITDGSDLFWSETKYPIRFIQLGNNAYAEFNSSIEVE